MTHRELDNEIGISQIYIWSTLAISLLVLVTSSAGIFLSSTYARETTDWILQARAQDIANIVTVGILLVGAYLMRRGSVRGLFLWIGSLLVLMYAFVIYAFAVHYNSLFLVYIATLSLIFWTILGGVLHLDMDKIKDVHPVGPRTRSAVSTFLLLSGLIFYFLWLSEDLPAALTGTVPSNLAVDGLIINPVHVLDIGFFLPAMIMNGIYLWRDKAIGYTFASPLLVFAALTGFGILVIDYLTSASGMAVAAGPESFVGTLVVIGTALTAAFLLQPRGPTSVELSPLRQD